ncbi:MAG: SpoIVB peptidase S55 [Acidobacteriota bacterium]|nr:SpoIVB peptidase S55 [Acidobacteriota bacterium]
MRLPPKEISSRAAALALALGALLSPALLPAQNAAAPAAPPPSSGGFYPLSQVHRGLTGTAWTVFRGSRPEPMEVEILGVLRGARGPGHDMILAQLHGAKPEYTGVVAGMSGSPVYIGNKLLGSLSYRIGQFSKDPIAGITPIEQMLEVRDLPVDAAQSRTASAGDGDGLTAGGMTFQAMETPLVMSGFRPEAIRLWQKQVAGTGLEMVAAGGASGSSMPQTGVSAAALASVEPGSAVSAQLVRGDLEISATCTVTYIDPKQLLACGHPILQAGPVSLPMTTTDVVATLASPLNAFKIVNTGEVIGAFTQDRDAAIRGILGAKANMIPVHIEVHGAGKERKLNIEVLDLPSLTPQALMVAVYNTLLETNESTAKASYHVTGDIDLDGYPPSPLDLWAPSGDSVPAPLAAAMQTGERFSRLYSNATRQGAVRSINLRIEAVQRNVQVDLEAARLTSGNIVHAGDTVVVEATLHPWQQPARNVRIPITLPARLGEGRLRLLVSDAGTLDRALDPPRFTSHTADMETTMAQARREHPADRLYVSLLEPDAQAEMSGQTLSSLPLSVANAVEPLRAAQDVSLNGESVVVAAEAPAGGVLSGFQILNLHIEAGGGLH